MDLPSWGRRPEGLEETKPVSGKVADSSRSPSGSGDGYEIRVLDLHSPQEIKDTIAGVGADPHAVRKLAEKMRHYNIMISGVEARAGIILKQEFLSLGGDAIVPRNFLQDLDNRGRVVISGTKRQIYGLIKKLGSQPFGIKRIMRNLEMVMENIEKEVWKIELPGHSTMVLGHDTKVMGVLNVTPDSFFDGGRYFERERAVERGVEMAKEGADLIDVGGESTRPGSKPIPAREEKARVLPVIEGLRERVDIPISIDTYKAEVAEEAINLGASLVNDISGLKFDERMAEVIAEYDTALILMHIRGRPETMQERPSYTVLMSEIIAGLREGIQRAGAAGVKESKILVDPGIGFGKTAQHNLFIMKNICEMKVLGRPVVVGTSRKSFLQKIFGWEPGERLEGSLASSLLCLMGGAAILRVHDVKETKKAVLVADAIRDAGIDEN